MPSDNVHSRSEELVNVERWAQANNLTLNRAKSQEIVFTDKRRQPRFQEFLANISRVDVIKILGVTVTNTLSVRERWTCQFTKCPLPANTQHPQHDSCFSPHHLQVSRRREARVRRKFMVGLRDGRRPKTTTNCHLPTRWRQKSTGIDMEQNYVTVTWHWYGIVTLLS